MSQDESKGFLDRETTRREFLKLAGKGMAGAVVSVSFLSMLGFTHESEAVAAFALSSGVLIADRNRCTGCQRCEINCTSLNDGKVQPFISRVKVSRNYNFGVDGPKISYWKEDGQHGNLLMTPETCKQCKDPACANACPKGAIIADSKTGARVVVKEKCIGCGSCTKACPWHLPTVDPETKTSSKCVLCGMCATNCPTSALNIIPWEDVKVAMIRRGYMLG
jgi:Fe-S-cluster-containing dehydrogenase component